MGYDTHANTIKAEYEKFYDYVRYRTFELLVEEITKKYSTEKLAKFSVAEAGVYLGNFAWIINELFPSSNLYLYDTFGGFDKKEIENELNRGYTDKEYAAKVVRDFSEEILSANEKIQIVKSRMKYPEKCIFRKGFFPETAMEDKNNKWVFVSLDMDLHDSILNGILFFYPNLVEGGYIMLHDYNNAAFNGIKLAVVEAEKILNVKLHRFPIADEGGTLIIQK